MENESEVDVNATETIDEVESTEVEETTVDETPKETKVEETSEAKGARLRRQLDQHNKKYGVKEESKPAPKAKTENELDWGQKAYLKSSGIDSSEFDFFTAAMAETGKDIDSLLSSKYFQAELKEQRESKSIEKATPKSSRLSAEINNNKVDSWISKGGLPPETNDNIQLRRDIVNKRYELAKAGRNFSK